MRLRAFPARALAEEAIASPVRSLPLHSWWSCDQSGADLNQSVGRQFGDLVLQRFAIWSASSSRRGRLFRWTGPSLGGVIRRRSAAMYASQSSRFYAKIT